MKRKYRVLFTDLDGTLINTRSGNVFPSGIWDMEIRLDVLEAMQIMKPEYVFIVTNQGGIEKGFVDPVAFFSKIRYIQSAIAEYLDIPANSVGFQICKTNNPESEYRKPNIGMIQTVFKNCKWSFLREKIKKSDCLMIGDASGKPGQYSDTDKQTALNAKMDYLDVDDFVKEYGLENDREERETEAGNVCTLQD